MSLDQQSISVFAKSISGEVFVPGQQEYDTTTQDRWNLFTLKYKPALIVRPKTVEDIQATVLFGKKVKKHVVPRNGAHSFKSQQDDIIVVDMNNFKKVQLDKDTGLVIAGGGLTLGELDDATAPWHIPVGINASTGAIGLGLHGGVGFQDRQHGYTVDNILAAKVVTANGDFVNASEKENPDLLWAIKGAGSSFGIVTEITFQSYHIDSVWAGVVGFPLSKENLDFLLDFGETIYNNTKAVFYVVSANTPDASMKVCMSLIMYYGPKEEAEKVFSPILEKNPIPIIPPKERAFNEIQKTLVYPPAYWYLTGGSVPGTTVSQELRSAIVEEFTAFPKTYSGGIVVEMRGGRGSEIPVSATAAPSDRTHRYDLVIMAGTSDPKEADELTEHVRRARDNFGIKSKSKGGLPAFATSTDFHPSVKEAYGENAEKLVAMKEKYDPENFFEGMINILPNKKFC